MKRRQNFSFSFSDSLLAEVGKVSQDALHFDVEAICQAYESIKRKYFGEPLLPITDLQAMYRHLATFEPYAITFYLERLDDEPKIQSLLEVA